MIDFKFWRKKRKLTRTQLATMIGTSSNYIYEIETKRKKASPDMIDSIIKALNICVIVVDALECTCTCNRCRKKKTSTSKRTRKKG